jgi:hypothetical protein
MSKQAEKGAEATEKLAAAGMEEDGLSQVSELTAMPPAWRPRPPRADRLLPRPSGQVRMVFCAVRLGQGFLQSGTVSMAALALREHHLPFSLATRVCTSDDAPCDVFCCGFSLNHFSLAPQVS